MRFFTRALYDQLDDEDANHQELLKHALDAYNSRLSEVEGTLGDLISIAHPFHVDDALVARLRQDRAAGELHLTLRCGNLVEGYRDLMLAYHDVQLDREDELALNEVAVTTVSHQIFEHDAYCHELDVDEDGLIVHRILFNWGIEITVRCRRLVHSEQSRSDRTLPPLIERTASGV